MDCDLKTGETPVLLATIDKATEVATSRRCLDRGGNRRLKLGLAPQSETNVRKIRDLW